jgi:dTDP-4-amino-4,6-dideoxyglucose
MRVSRPSLPDPDRYAEVLAEIWERGILSNQGPCANAFEAAFADYAGVRAHVRCASSADLGLALAVRALGLPEGARALVPSMGFPSTVHALEWNGLRPYFVDVDGDDWCLHAEQLAGLAGGAAAIVATHLFGVACDVAGLEELARASGAVLVLDAAQAVATTIGGRHAADFGDAAVVSFSGTKAITAGEGGMVVLRSREVAERFARLRSYGLDTDRTSVDRGLNAKLSELHAALGVVALAEADAAMDARRLLVDRYRARLAEVPGVALQRHPAGTISTPTYFAVALDGARDHVAAALAAEHIEARPYFPALHAMARLRTAPAAPLPVTERLAGSLLALPLHTGLAPADVDEVCDIVDAALDQPRRPDG